MNLIGHPLTQHNAEPNRLRFLYRGRPETLPQAVFVAMIGVAVCFTSLPRGLSTFLFVVAGFLAVGGFANCLEAVDLRIDPVGRTWQIVRGLRFKPARVSGNLDDFAGLFLGMEQLQLDWVLVLYPKGSYRGYGLNRWPKEQKDQAMVFARRLSVQLTLPLLQEVPQRESERLRQARLKRVREDADFRRPPSGNITVVSPVPSGVEVRLRLRRSFEILRVLESGIQKVHSFFGRERAATVVEWKDVTDISIETITRVIKGGARSSWYLRPDWRVRMEEWWTARLAELKRPAIEPPPWALPFFFFEEFPFRTLRALTIRTKLFFTITFANERILGEEETAWLEAALKRFASRRSIAGGPENHQ